MVQAINVVKKQARSFIWVSTCAGGNEPVSSEYKVTTR